MADYTEEQLAKIARDIVGQSTQARRDGAVFLGKYVQDDWDDEKFIAEDMYEMYLKAYQRPDKSLTDRETGQTYTVPETFEEFLKDALDTLKWRIEDLNRERAAQLLSQREHQNGLDTAQRSMAAIRKYLELPNHLRLIGV